MEVVRPILGAALLATVLGLVFEFTGSNDIVDAGAKLCALATWIAPALILAKSSWNRKPQSSLASVGVTISIVAFAMMFSVAGILLALLTLIFARAGQWAWPALLAIAAFWLSGAILLYVASRRSGRGKERGRCSG